jgi:Rnl2 family RNA ligase
MEFRKYSSIENLKASEIKAIKKHGYDNVEWIATEKVHGSNFSVTIYKDEYDDVKVVAGKRTAFLEENEKFNSYESVVEKYKKGFINLYEMIPKIDTEVVVRVYGELYGGAYPGYKNNMPAVQKGIYYAPYNDFIIFDISINGSYISYDMVVAYCSTVGLQYIRELARGKLDDLRTMSSEFESTIYELHGLEKVKDNFAEGYILKPNEPLYFPSKSRVILKNKHPKFSEKVHKKYHDVISDAFDVTDDIKNKIEIGLSYLNENRMNNVLSKLSDDEKTHQSKISGLLMKDALEDMFKDHQIELVGKEKKYIYTELRKVSDKLVFDVLLQNK